MKASTTNQLDLARSPAGGPDRDDLALELSNDPSRGVEQDVLSTTAPDARRLFGAVEAPRLVEDGDDEVAVLGLAGTPPSPVGRTGDARGVEVRIDVAVHSQCASEVDDRPPPDRVGAGAAALSSRSAPAFEPCT